MKYAVLITLHDGTQEVCAPVSASRVERLREQCESVGWCERASVVSCYSPSSVRADIKHAKGDS